MSQNSPSSNPDDLPRKRWTYKEYQALFEMGLIPERTELIEGEIWEKTSQSRLHLVVTTQLRGVLMGVWGMENMILWGPCGVGVNDDDTSDPEPDLTILTRPLREFKDRWPYPNQEVHLAVEVSDPVTLRIDLNIKSHIYSRAGVPEYWVVNVEGRELIVHRQPGANGYADMVTLEETDIVSPLAAPASQIAVRDLLP